VQANRDGLEYQVAEGGHGSLGVGLESEEPADGAATGLGAGECEFPAPVGDLHHGTVRPRKPALLIPGTEPGSG
jgi:hypothetical protein